MDDHEVEFDELDAADADDVYPAEPDDSDFTDTGSESVQPPEFDHGQEDDASATSTAEPGIKSPQGIRRNGPDGLLLFDALAGRACALGLGDERIREAIRKTAAGYLGDACDLSETDLSCSNSVSDDGSLLETIRSIRDCCADASEFEPDTVLIYPSADLAIESMIAIARKRTDDSRYRTITVSGSDHGRTAMCRSASGRPELQAKFGPMMAGFDHVKPGDLASMKSAIDETTAAIMLSPIDFHDDARAIDSKYLHEVRRLCDEHDLMLLIDESRLCIGASGRFLTFESIADIAADAVVVAAGLFAGLPGGMLLTTSHFTIQPVSDTVVYPLQTNVAAATLMAMAQQQLPFSALETVNSVAVSIAQRIAGYDFIRDIHAVGLTIGIETDLPADQIVKAASKNRVRLAVVGDTSVMIQLPLVIEPIDLEVLLDRLAHTMNTMEQSHATSTDAF